MLTALARPAPVALRRRLEARRPRTTGGRARGTAARPTAPRRGVPRLDRGVARESSISRAMTVSMEAKTIAPGSGNLAVPVAGPAGPAGPFTLAAGGQGTVVAPRPASGRALEDQRAVGIDLAEGGAAAAAQVAAHHGLRLPVVVDGQAEERGRALPPDQLEAVTDQALQRHSLAGRRVVHDQTATVPTDDSEASARDPSVSPPAQRSGLPRRCLPGASATRSRVPAQVRVRGGNSLDRRPWTRRCRGRRRRPLRVPRVFSPPRPARRRRHGSPTTGSRPVRPAPRRPARGR